MSGFDISKYRTMFLDESVELFENIDTLLLRAEEIGMLSDEEMKSLFRYIHTLKGSSASIGLSKFTQFTHEIESFMDRLRNKQLVYRPEMATLLIDCIDTMKVILDDEINDMLSVEKFDELTKEYISAIKELSEERSLKNAPVAVLPKSESQKYDEDAFGFFDDTFYVDSKQQDMSKSADEDGFGFFDDDIIIEHAKHAVTHTNYDDEGFGFFDDIYYQVSKAPTVDFGTYPAISDDEGFGFFDDDLIIASLNQRNKPAQTNSPLMKKNDSITTESDLHDTQTPKQTTTSHVTQQVQSKIITEPTIQPTSAEEKPQSTTESTHTVDAKSANSIRVDLSKIDVLMNNVGELVIVNSMLFQLADEINDSDMKAKIAEKLKLLDRHTRELQDSVMSVRMVPMENIYSKFPKTLRDISKKLGKKVEFKHIGDNVEIDKAMIEGLTDPLMHIVRNSLDHGIETPEVRRQRGKPESGTILISAEQANGQIIISISDDGGGISADKVANKAVENGVITQSQYNQMSHDDKVMMIFSPGLSTAEQITDISGRGVGMDVVKTNITKLGGSIGIKTELGIGTAITIALPLTLAILDGLNIRIGEKYYILPLASIIESLQPLENMIKRIGDGEEELLMLRQEFIPVVRLHKLFHLEPTYHNLHDGMIIVVRAGTQKLALFIDEFLHQQQVVVKPIDKNFRNVIGIGGATVRGDGSIGLIIDVIGILEEQKKLERRRIR